MKNYFLLFIYCLLYFTNANMIKISLNLSQAPYCDSSKDWTCPTCSNGNFLNKVIEKDGERCLLGYNEELNSIFVSFRGSTNIENWIDNIQIKRTCPYSHNESICVEKGFYKVYDKLKYDVFYEIKEIEHKYKTNNLLLTGHSLGAALSTLLAYDVNRKFDYNVTLITFGSPRIGNDKFVYDLFKYPIISNRITHYYDMVPHLPQNILGYLHIPNEIWYNEENTIYKICNDNINEEDNECSNSCAPLKCKSVSDHLNYLNITMGTGNC